MLPRRDLAFPVRNALVAVAWLSSSAVYADSTDPTGTLAKLSVDWVKTRAEAVRAETEWASQRELLDSTAKALAEHARELEEARDPLKILPSAAIRATTRSTCSDWRTNVRRTRDVPNGRVDF